MQPNSPSRRASGQAAFTLIELLVVIAIISLLVAVLMPSLQRARELARSVACMAHLRALAIAQTEYDCSFGQVAQYYYEDPGSGFEKNVPWFYWLRKNSYLEPYPRAGMWEYSAEACAVLTCSQEETIYAGYVMNGQDYGLWKSLKDFVTPSNAILLGDGTYYLYYGCMSHLGYRWINGLWRWDLAAADGSITNTNKLAPRHLGGANFAYVDGHVDSLTVEERPEGTIDYASWMWNGIRGQ